MGLLTQNDARLFRGFFKEAAKLRGIPVQYSYPITVSTTIYAEYNPEMSTPEDMDIIFIENPKPNTLKKIGWVSENKDDKPYIMLLPYDAKNLCTLCEVHISPIDTLSESPRVFRITKITTLLEYPDCWTCIVAPVFTTEPAKENYDQTNYNYLKSSEDPEADSTENIVFIHGNTEDVNYTYIDKGDK